MFIDDLREIENALLRHTGIREAAVIVVADDDDEKAVKAIVVPAPGARLSEAEALAFARSQLGGKQHPRSVEFVHQLPEEGLNPPGGTAPRGDGST